MAKWQKGMQKVPGSGRKKGTPNKHTWAVRKAQRLATLKMAERTPEVVESMAKLMMNPKTTVWVRVKLFETWMRHSMPIPQVSVETEKVSVGAAGDLAVTLIKQAEEQVEDLASDETPAIEAKVITDSSDDEDQQAAN